MFKILLSAFLLLSGCIGSGTPAAFATVSSNVTKVQFAGDGVSTSFSFGSGGYSVPVYLQTVIQVYVSTSGSVTQLTLNTNYSVSLTAVPYTLSNSVVYYTAIVNLAGGSSPYGALPVGTTLILNRSIPYTNLLNISDYSSTPATTWNQGYDRATMLAQQLYTLTQQAVLQPVTATSPISIPPSNNGYILCWSGTTLANCANNGTGTPIPVPVPNSDLQTLTQANLVNGTSITNLAGVPQSAWNALSNSIQNGGINWSSIPSYPTSAYNWGVLVASSQGINWIDMNGITPNSGLFGNTNVGGILGPYNTSYSITTNYLAATDLFISTTNQLGTGGGSVSILWGTVSPATNYICQQEVEVTGSGGNSQTCSAVIKKGYYWQVTNNNSSSPTITATPIGS